MKGALLAALTALACAAPPPPPPLVEFSDGRPAMGTILEITLFAPAAPARARDARRAVRAAQSTSTRRSRSTIRRATLSRLNRAAGHGAIPVDPELAQHPRGVGRLLAAHARGLRRDGRAARRALDARRRRRACCRAPRELARARALVGASQIQVEGSEAALAHEGVSVDLGGIAKGWALDRMLPLLRARGIERALLDFGQSSVWALGAPPGAAGWRLLARGPDESALGVLTLVDQALSISGSLGQWVEIGGRRYGHVLDPRSGQALEQRRQALVRGAERDARRGALEGRC